MGQTFLRLRRRENRFGARAATSIKKSNAGRLAWLASKPTLAEFELGFRAINDGGDADAELYAAQLPKVVRALTNEGWHIEAEGKLYRTRRS